MKPTLFDLWNGNLCPVKEFGKNIPEIDELEKLIDGNSEKLISTLNDEQKERFSCYTDCINEYIGYANEEAFCYGFGLAIKMIMEINK